MAPTASLARRWSTKLRPEHLKRKLFRRSITEQPAEPLLVRQAIEDDSDSEPAATPDGLTSSTNPGVERDPLSSLVAVPSESTSQQVLQQSDSNSTNDNDTDTEPFPDFDPAIVCAEEGENGPASHVDEPTETAAEDPDAIMPAPPPKEEKTESRVSVASTVIGSSNELRAVTCFICGLVIGKTRPSGKLERLAYLPCGHVFGHDCLFRWISNPEGIKRCPLGDCVAVRHLCEHWTAPTRRPPPSNFTDTTTEVLPWNYEFCKTPKGIKLHETISTSLEKVQRLDAQKLLVRRSPFDFTIDGKRLWHSRTLEDAENKLNEQQKAWWKTEWEGHARAKQKQSLNSSFGRVVARR